MAEDKAGRYIDGGNLQAFALARDAFASVFLLFFLLVTDGVSLLLDFVRRVFVRIGDWAAGLVTTATTGQAGGWDAAWGALAGVLDAFGIAAFPIAVTSAIGVMWVFSAVYSRVSVRA